MARGGGCGLAAGKVIEAMAQAVRAGRLFFGPQSLRPGEASLAARRLGQVLDVLARR